MLRRAVSRRPLLNRCRNIGHAVAPLQQQQRQNLQQRAWFSETRVRRFATIVEDGKTTQHRNQEKEEEDALWKGERVSDDVDLCIVGGGPAGLCAAIR